MFSRSVIGLYKDCAQDLVFSKSSDEYGSALMDPDSNNTLLTVETLYRKDAGCWAYGVQLTGTQYRPHGYSDICGGGMFSAVSAADLSDVRSKILSLRSEVNARRRALRSLLMQNPYKPWPRLTHLVCGFSRGGCGLEFDVFRYVYLAHINVPGCCDWLPAEWLAYPAGLVVLLFSSVGLLLRIVLFVLVWVFDVPWLCCCHVVRDQERQWLADIVAAPENQQLCSRRIDEHVFSEMRKIAEQLSERAGMPFHAKRGVLLVSRGTASQLTPAPLTLITTPFYHLPTPFISIPRLAALVAAAGRQHAARGASRHS